MNRITFYDPLYDFVSFEDAERERPRGIFDPGFSTSPVISASKSLLPFLGTPEFSRLSFLRQSDLAFLVYPSATHTRFAHAVGCCYLGYVAAREIMVTIKNEPAQQIFLSKWLEDRGWKEEFLLSLLLHDVGHFAFSHAFENNVEMWNALKLKVDHEDVACQLIRGSGELVDAFWRRREDLREYNCIADIISKSPDIDAKITAYLISGKEDIIADYDPNARAALHMLHELTSGLLDLDRIDHYRRDSYFTGMKFASNLNFASLLNGFNICYQSDEVGGRHEVRLSKEAIGHALTLLHSKERLVHDCFENTENLAYEVMLHQAFNYLCFGDDFYYQTGANTPELSSLKELIFELLMTTDEELLLHMLSAGTEKVKNIVNRIRIRKPYSLIGRRVCVRRDPMDIFQLRKMITQAAAISFDEVVIRLSTGYGKTRERRPQEWLHLDALNDESGFPLAEHDEYKMQIEHFKKVQDSNPNIFWLFTPSSDPAIQSRLRTALDSILERRA